MSTREERIQVFEDTQNWITSNPVLSASVDKAKKKTTIYYENDYPTFDSSKSRKNAITISGDRSFQAAMRLRREYPDAKIAVMNFANAFHAGGGVTKGSSAQEESLCRTSTLYPLIYRRTLRDTFYKHHKDLNTPKASDSLIYTEGVIICKTDDDLPKRMPQEHWVSIDVITIAAPDLRTKSNPHAPLVGKGAFMNNAELFGYHVKRAIHMLTCAAAQNADILVLGAFGCGAFENDPNVVARAYRIALEEFPRVFERIEFAIYCPAGKNENYEAFERELNITKETEPVIWFEKDEEQNPVLVKETGERITSRNRSDMFDMTIQSQEGWRRSMLYMEANGIWDATGFGATMSATLAYGPNSEGKCYTFTSCEEADRRMYKNLTENQIVECRKNVDEFYSDPDLQRKWQPVLLHPICLILRKDGSLEPISLRDLDPGITERYMQNSIQIGEKESYRWIFDS